MRWLSVLAVPGTLLVAVAVAAPAASQAPATPGQVVILGANGDPAGGATVTVLRPAAQQLAAVGAVTHQPSAQGPTPTEAILLGTATTAEGVVKDALPRLPGLTLIVDHPTHLPFFGSYPNEPPPGVIRLQAGRTANGVVRESEGGDPVAGARVCAFWRDSGAFASFGPSRRCVDTAERGLFELAGLPAGNLQATAEAPGFETDARTIEQGRRPSRIVFDLVAKEDAAGGAEPAPASANVRVELVGEAGEPIRNFTMWAFGVVQRGTAGSAVEDADGPVSVPINAFFAGETAVDISFQADGYLRSPLIRVAPIPGGEIELGLIALDRGAVVQGRLFDAAGAEPAAGCLVELLLAGGGPAIQTARMRNQHLAVSDADGEYLLGGLEVGRYYLRLQCPDVPVTDRLLALGASELADQGESWLHPGRRVAVVVDGLGGGAIRLLDRFRESGALIVDTPLHSSAEAGAGERGDKETSVRAEFLAAPGTYRLEVADETGGLRVSQEIAVEEGLADVQTVDVRLPTRTIRSVLVLDGRPVSGGTVSFGSVLDPRRSSSIFMIVTQGGHQRAFPGGAGSVRRLSGEVGPDGAFAVERVPAGLLWMTWSPGDGTSVGRLWSADPLPQIDLSGVRVAGQLFDETGAPAAGQVSLLGDLGRMVAYAETDDHGSFELPPAPPLAMGRLLELRCRASDCAGEPLSFLSVTTESGAEIASHLTGAGEGVRFSDSGQLGLGCVTPGSYEVSFWAAGRRWGAEVNVSSTGRVEEPVVVNGREAEL